MARVSLTNLAAGQSAYIVALKGGLGLQKRFNVLGLRPGKQVTKISSFFQKGPVTVSLDNLQLALGYGMARKVIVEVDNGEKDSTHGQP